LPLSYPKDLDSTICNITTSRWSSLVLWS